MWWKRRSPDCQPDRVGSFEERYAMARRFGSNGLSFLALYDGWEYFAPPGNPGFVAFERHRGAAVVCGDPVCAPEHEEVTLAAFLAFCAREKLTPAFANATPRFLPRYAAAGLAAIKVGEEPLFDVGSWAPRGDRAKKVRSAANQARKNGVTIEVLPTGATPSAALERDVAAVIAEWRATRNVKALGFTLRLAPLAHPNDKIVVLARSGGRLEAFLTCVPYDDGKAYYLEDLVRRKSAPTGATELLVIEAIAEAGRRGATVANFGLAPLRGCRVQPGGRRFVGWALDFTFRRLNLFYRFRPLEHFKSKFAPSRYEPSYLVYPPNRLPRAAVGLLSAFTPGAAGPVSTAVSRLQKKDAQGGSVFDLPIAAVSAAASAALLGMLWLAPGMPVHAILLALRPMVFAEGLARAHLFVDLVLLAAGGSWWASARRR
jgi:phosphatidylglycerol lysyltransferase